MPYPETAEGFMVQSQKDWKNFKKQEFKLKPFEDRDIDIAIECCGVCGSDVHTINGGWGDAPMPLCVGHEVIGKAVKVGKDVKTVKVGDRVGVGELLGIMSFFNHAQPALLYLVPGVLLSLWGTALLRGELKEMWNFTEAINAEQVEEENKADKVTDKKKPDERSLWRKLWDELMGSSEETPGPAKSDDAKTDRHGDKGTDQSEDGKDGKKSNDTLVAFSIVRYRPQERNQQSTTVGDRNIPKT